MKEKCQILVVDDEPHMLRATSRLMKSAGYEVIEATTGNDCLRLTREKSPGLILLDVMLPDINGVEVCRRIKADNAFSDSYVILLSSLRTESDSQSEGLEEGADGYIARPIPNRELLARVEAILRMKQREEALRKLSDQVDGVIEEHAKELEETREQFAGIIGKHTAMLDVFDLIRQVATNDVTVLIQGESGTGKELVASAIHHEGNRADKPFVAVNCGGLPAGTLESELFGHVKGAFTGAIRDKKGRFELADGGTIFLDEVGELSAEAQAKLLRVLQERTFERVGGETTIKVDVRIIAATNKDLRQEATAGNFRRDLYYRLCVVPIDLPPLRQRKTDIPLLAKHFLKQTVTEAKQADCFLANKALAVMMAYDWPGNVRELQNAIQYALVMCTSNIINPSHLPAAIFSQTEAMPKKRHRKRKLELYSVHRALQETNGNKYKAAQILGVSRSTIYRFLAENDI